MLYSPTAVPEKGEKSNSFGSFPLCRETILFCAEGNATQVILSTKACMVKELPSVSNNMGLASGAGCRMEGSACQHLIQADILG